MKKRMLKKISITICAVLLMFSFTAMTGCGTTARKSTSSTYYDTYKVACCPNAVAYMYKSSPTAKRGQLSVMGCKHISCTPQQGGWEKISGGFNVWETKTGKCGVALWANSSKTSIGFELID